MMTTLTAADGHEFGCWMEKADGGNGAGIVILQEIFGITDQLKSVAKRYAALGYNVAIPALFDRQKRDTVVPFNTPLVGRDMMDATKLEETMMDIDATVKSLGDKVAVMGFCWGGGLVFRAAQTLDIVAGISFYGTRLPEYLDRPLKVPVFGHFGKTDDHTPLEVLTQVTDYLDGVEIHLYDAGHAFANNARPDPYDETSAELAHKRNEAFLKTHLG